MSSRSPVAEGFRIIFRRPSIPFAEIAWRWSFAAAFWYLCAAFLIEFANTLPVDTVDRLLLGTQQPILIVQAVHRIFHGSAIGFTRAGVLLGIAMTLAWLALATLGRVSTLRALIEELGMTAPESAGRRTISSLLILNFLGAAATLALVVAGVGAIIFASSLWASSHAPVSVGARLWFALVFLAWTAWSVLNWHLSTASIFIVTERNRVLEAVASAANLWLQRPGTLATIGFWFGLAHAGAFIAAGGAGLVTIGMIRFLGPGPVLLFECLIVLLYCAAADFLYIGKLAAYMAMIRGELEHGPSKEDEILPSGSTNLRTPIDQGELILSDVPRPAS